MYSGRLAGLLVPVIHRNALVAKLAARVLNCPPVVTTLSPKIKGPTTYGVATPDKATVLQSRF